VRCVSKENCLSETFFVGLKLAILDLAGFQKLSVLLQELLSNWSEGYELHGCQKLSVNSKAFDA
jgi:hypothetical protein